MKIAAAKVEVESTRLARIVLADAGAILTRDHGTDFDSEKGENGGVAWCRGTGPSHGSVSLLTASRISRRTQAADGGRKSMRVRHRRATESLRGFQAAKPV